MGRRNFGRAIGGEERERRRRRRREQHRLAQGRCGAARAAFWLTHTAPIQRDRREAAVHMRAAHRSILPAAAAMRESTRVRDVIERAISHNLYVMTFGRAACVTIAT